MNRRTMRAASPKRSGRRRQPLAVVVSNSVIAARAFGRSREWVTRFRSKISLLAFEEPEWAELTSPQLSVIRQPVKAIAREAWELLLRRMHGEAFPVQRLELRAEIELRESVQAVRRERRRA